MRSYQSHLELSSLLGFSLSLGSEEDDLGDEGDTVQFQAVEDRAFSPAPAAAWGSFEHCGGLEDLERDTWSCQIMHCPKLPGWPPAYIQIAAGHTALSTTRKGASIWQPHTTAFLLSAQNQTLQEVQYLTVFSTTSRGLSVFQVLFKYVEVHCVVTKPGPHL